MKKLSLILLSAILSVSLLTACSSTQTEETQGEVDNTTSQTQETTPAVDPVDVRVAALKGPTAMGLTQFMSSNEMGEITDNNYSFDIVVDPAEVTAFLAKGEVDIAAVPANLASIVYNNTQGAIQVLGINTLGVLYIVENGETISSIEDLKGQTIYATGKGATPEYALRYILSSNGIDPDNDVTIEFKSESAEVLSAISANENAIAMLPEPFVTTALSKVSTLRVALDLTAEWDAIQDGNKGSSSSLVTGVIVARKEFVENNPEAVEAFLNHYNESVNFINSNVDEGAALVAKYEITTEEVAKVAIPKCNIVLLDNTSNLQPVLSGYLQVLFDQNPASVGGVLPADDFYYERQQ